MSLFSRIFGASQPITKIPTDVTALVHADLEARTAAGLETYGKAFKTHDGRDSLWDCYEEALDLVQYLRKVLYERDGK